MRHKHGYNKLGRDSAHRRAMLRNMATSLINEGRITTTLPKAKELRSVVEKMVTLGKKGSLHNRRQAAGYLFDKKVCSRSFRRISSSFQRKTGWLHSYP